MKYIFFFVFLLFFTLIARTQSLKIPKVETGISQELAIYRKSTINTIQYKLDLIISEKRTESIQAKEEISFNYKKQPNTNLQIDFKSPPASIKSISVNNKTIIPKLELEHLLINDQYLQQGTNIISITFIAGDAALNRREGYLYTLFVPDRARTMFPCFDQPDLKARFALRLTLPKTWQAIANGALLDTLTTNNQKTYHFANSDLLPTYLFSFAAGIFRNKENIFCRKNIQLLYRETDSTKIENSLDSIFRLYTNAVNYYEKWTTIPYPFQKNGMIAIPDFQFGGMEHPGSILFQNGTLFLDKNATQNQLNNRSNLIAHEVAHMWFGDMVTMNWFTDVWMKEVFANYMADKSTGALANKSVYDLKFLTTHFPNAYTVDRTIGANPIRQTLSNLQNAGMLYGYIIYDKAPIMMRQLEMMMGETNFQKGVSEYLKKYAYSNASWLDLITCLSKYTKEDLQNWNKVWVNETGRPIIKYNINYKDDKIAKFTLAQNPEYGKGKKLWKEKTDIALYYKDTIISKKIDFNKQTLFIDDLKGLPKPLFALLNTSGIGYGVFEIDTIAMQNFSVIKDPVSRASYYISSYESMLNNMSITPDRLLDFFSQQLEKETTELSLRLICNYINIIYWEFISKKKRLQISPLLENTVWNSLHHQITPNNKKILFECYENIFQSQNAYDNLYQIWATQASPENIMLNEEDYTSLSLSLALRNNENNTLLQEQLARIKNADRINRYKIIMQGVSSNKETRNIFFANLSKKENRVNESAIGAALYYLHHPLRQIDAIEYLPNTLKLLQEIQKTGDIFFPDNWLRSTFTYYQAPKALQIVNDFLYKHTLNYNPVLRNKILQATDNLRRAQKLVKY